ncbi:MAG: DUF4402 domain-containing protein [Pseudomonadota bacterium]
MTKTIRFGAAGAALVAALGMTTAAHAQDTATADARAEVLDALVLTLQTGTALDFGAIVVNGADTLTLTPANTMDCVAKQVVCSGTTDVPDFTITGTPSKAVTINLPTTSIDLVLQGSSGVNANEVMQLTAVSSSQNGASGPETTLDTNGDGAFSVGGTLNIGPNQDAGIYEATFSVSVEYS